MGESMEQLRKTDILKNLTDAQIEKVLGIARTVEFPAGAVIMKEGEEGDTIYIIREGTVEVVKSLIMGGDEQAADKSKVFTRLDASGHAVFGEMALLETTKRSATIKAVTKCKFYEIKGEDFLHLAEDDHELGFRIIMNVARIVSARLRKADEDTVKLTTALSIILSD